jgi:hypothetical protein
MFDKLKAALEGGVALVEADKSEILELAQFVEDIGKGDFADGFGILEELVNAARPVPSA